MSARRDAGTRREGLGRALDAVGLTVAPEPMADTGLAHAHFRLPGTGLILRIPKQSQMRLGAAENLAFQSACYARASVCGHAPRIAHVLPPTEALPRGGLVVEEITGRPARLPEDLPAMIDALAAIHRLDLPERQARPPLLDPADPPGDLLAEISAQAEYLTPAGIAPATDRIVRDGIARLRGLVADTPRPPKRLISFDAHPGNFLIDRNGRAILVDLEKCRYSAPQLDLAHATLYTSTTWDVASHAVLDADDVARAHDHWLDRIGAADWTHDAARWLLPMRRAMWLWSMTWCAKWRVLSREAARRDGGGEDWSSEASDAALVDHVRGRVDHYLEPETAAMVAGEFCTLDARIGLGQAGGR